MWDALGALQVLGADARFDRGRIGIVGWSRGGGVAFNTALETVRKSMITDDLKFALHVVFYGPADIQYRDRATDLSPVLFLHGEADNYVPIGPTREFADWLQSQGNPVTFVSYPKAQHDFDVQGGSQGFVKNLEVGAKCDLVFDIATGRTIRMNHADAPAATAEDIRAYFRSCITRGANLSFDAAVRANGGEEYTAFSSNITSSLSNARSRWPPCLRVESLRLRGPGQRQIKLTRPRALRAFML
jgi:dienelactone hydrolase